jgi:CheY-like chemotaxis protein
VTARSDGAPLSVLLLEDDPADAELNLIALREGGFNVQARIASTAEAFERHLDEATFDVVLSDYRLRGWTGVEALAQARTGRPAHPGYRNAR